tara:strand:- start:317 stop:667 length:351 start_codon:yes stop_codon:yes gene_type:complete
MSLTRPICNKCNKNACAVNYVKDGTRHYRSMCHVCKKKNPKRPHVYLWQRAGYNKDTNCFLCGFKSQYSTQTTVYHIDGDITNVDFVNLRTVCLNCVEIVKKKEVNWKRGDLTVDY